MYRRAILDRLTFSRIFLANPSSVPERETMERRPSATARCASKIRANAVTEGASCGNHPAPHLPGCRADAGPHPARAPGQTAQGMGLGPADPLDYSRRHHLHGRHQPPRAVLCCRVHHGYDAPRCARCRADYPRSRAEARLRLSERRALWHPRGRGHLGR